ncbi:ATP-binding cassette domain-containing protein [Paenibacillus larvae subsp. larvae]|uniref:ATP-binding cassette domain-containing protein n=1 Tax=Paenibacillus larvae TaxID=1464 RepID=UPI0023A950E4|nr:ATP-binding cassette domain-containing protein [Paenibacillus larvae]MDE5137797.1 ATP-binding cassette domain-containing protein [Paenibacillus larvae subsp. larvae]
MIVAEKLSKTFTVGKQTVEAVSSISFSIQKGEIYCLLGSNGAGKSTTVLILSTLLRPSGGTAKIAGYDLLQNANAIRSIMGIVNQETGLDPLLTGKNIVTLHAKLWGYSRKEAKKRTNELLERYHLLEAADRPLKTYSGGMRRRLDLALALVRTPKVLFLDEPTTGLDPVSRRIIWEEVKMLRDQGVTVLLTTQYLDEADVLADRIGIVMNGTIAIENTPSALKKQYGQEYITILLDNAGQAKQVAQLYPDAVIDQAEVKLKVADCTNEAPQILSVLHEQHIKITSISITQPTLEDIYLSTTGYQVRGESNA